MASVKLSAEARRQAIIEAATQLFSERGFRGVTTRELALACGVSEPVLYQHFEHKRDIYSAIVESKSCQVENRFENTKLAVSDYEKDDRTVLREIALTISRWYEEDATLSRLLLFSSLEGHEFSDLFFARHASAQFDLIKQYFEHRINNGIFRPTDPVTAVWTFIGMVAHHSMVRNLFHFDPYPQKKEHVIEQMIDVFLSGMEAETKHV